MVSSPSFPIWPATAPHEHERCRYGQQRLTRSNIGNTGALLANKHNHKGIHDQHGAGVDDDQGYCQKLRQLQNGQNSHGENYQAEVDGTVHRHRMSNNPAGCSNSYCRKEAEQHIVPVRHIMFYSNKS